MASEWKMQRLDQLGRIVTGKTPSSKGEGYFGGSIPFVTPTDFDGRRIISDTGRYLSEEGATSVASARIPADTVMVTCIGSDMGKAAIAGCDCVTNQQINSILVEDDNHPQFVYYNLCGRKDEIRSTASGSAQPILNKSGFGALKINLPPLPEQQAIACILGALDDKIELNRQRNRTLEAMARAIFQSWFVDFDPVNANAAGQHPPGLSKEIAALFPDSFEESGLGPIPKGWRVAKLGDVADVNWGDTSVTKNSYTDQGFIAYSAKGPDGFLSYYDFDRVGIVVSAIGANSGFTWLARGKWSCIKNTLRLWTTTADISTEYLFFATHGNKKWPLRGSAQPFISQSDARNMRVLYPANGVAMRFGQLVAPFFERVHDNEYESLTLAALRDTLLPKLIFGQLRVPDADRIIGRGK